VTGFQSVARHIAIMFREVAIAVVALAAFDYFYLDGKYVHAIEMATRSLLHFVIG
jgi:hypothetical protein